MQTLVYTDGGDCYHGEQDLGLTGIKGLQRSEKANGSVGYMIGYRNWNNQRQRVIVFFRDKHQSIRTEEKRRRDNGFLGARWYSL